MHFSDQRYPINVLDFYIETKSMINTVLTLLLAVSVVLIWWSFQSNIRKGKLKYHANVKLSQQSKATELIIIIIGNSRSLISEAEPKKLEFQLKVQYTIIFLKVLKRTGFQENYAKFLLNRIIICNHVDLNYFILSRMRNIRTAYTRVHISYRRNSMKSKLCYYYL